jgi:CMP-N,N'-diacetyllegionaminic acid synthase
MNTGVLAIIPARGGSKRLPRKNLLHLAGKPLIAWTIEAAQRSRAVDRVIVSTEDLEIAAVAKSYGAEVPFMRPSELATDNAKTIDVVLDILLNVQHSGRLVLLQPTSPLRTARHIDEAYKLMDKRRASAVVSVSEAIHPPEWTNSLPEDGGMDMFMSKDMDNKRKQDLPVNYYLNGAIYFMDVLMLMHEKSFLPATGAYAYTMDKLSSVDIDDEVDFMLAEVLMKRRLITETTGILPNSVGIQ